jgi:hypothetical protein
MLFMYKIVGFGLGVLSILFAIPYVNADVDHLVLLTDESLERAIDYCYNHLSDQDPVQDLIDANK